MPEHELDPLRTGPHVPEPSRSLDRTASRTNTVGGPTAEPTAPGAVPGYEILGELGRGGMGVVYRARHLKLNREVALKMVLGGAHGERRELIRFLAEAEAVAAVKHENVVQVYDYGEAAGRPFLALEYLPGGTLAERISAGGRLGPVAAAELVAKVARGVAAAHAQDIVHRDLKPQNVLLSADGEPKVTDFGLAKRRGAAGVTQTGAIVGTPAYMAPEQADGTKFVGPAADVWALGAILYECLTGKRPFRAGGTNELLAQILNAEPEFSRDRAAVPRDLELVCRKCLEKAAADRYPGAAELADDLERYAAGEPISVRPAGALERAVKWARRKPTAAAAAALAVLLVVVGGLGAFATVEGLSADRARGAAEGERGRAEAARDAEKGARLETAAALAREAAARTEADRQRENFEAVSAARAIDIAYREWQGGNVGRAAQLLDAVPERFRAWEWNYVRRLCRRELVPLPIADGAGVAISPDGSRLLAFTAGGGQQLSLVQRFALFDLATRKQLPTPGLPPAGTEVCARSRDPKVLRFVFWGPDADAKGAFAAHIVDPFAPATALVIHGIPADRAGPSAVALGADGTRLLTLTRDGKARLWNAATGEALATLDGPFAVGPLDAEGVSLSADGTVANFVNTRTQAQRFIETATGKELASFKLPPAGAGVVHLPAGRILLNPYQGGETACYDLARPDKPVFAFEHSNGFFRWTVSPDGARVAALGPNGCVGVWDAVTGRAGATMLGARGKVYGLAWAPDGRRLATGGADRLVRVWDAATGELVNTLHGADRDISAIAFGPKGIVATSATGGAIVFDADRSPEFARIAAQPQPSCSPAFGPDGVLVALTDYAQNPTQVFDTATGAALCRLPGRAAFATDGRVLTFQRGLRGWDPRTGAAAEPYKAPADLVRGNQVVAGVLASDGRYAVFGGLNRTDVPTTLIDVTTGKEIATLLPADPPRGGEARGRTVVFRFDPDGTQLAAIVADPAARRAEYRSWSTATGAALRTRPIDLPGIEGFGHPAANPMPSSQFRLSAAIKREGRVGVLSVLLDPRTGEELARIEVPPERGKFLAFSPDGTRALIAARGGELRIVNTKLGQEVLALTAHPEGSFEGVASAEFSPDGTRIVTCGNFAGGVKVWDGRPLPPKP